MKYKLTLYCLAFCFISFSQNNSDIKYQEVVIVLYDDYKNNLTKRRTSSSSINEEKNHYWYLFYFNKIDRIELIYKEYADFDEMERDNPVLFFKVDKSFLRKNKDIILTKEKMLKLGYKETFKLLQKAKHILLIDKSEINNGKITIKEVSHFYIL